MCHYPNLPLFVVQPDYTLMLQLILYLDFIAGRTRAYRLTSWRVSLQWSGFGESCKERALWLVKFYEDIWKYRSMFYPLAFSWGSFILMGLDLVRVTILFVADSMSQSHASLLDVLDCCSRSSSTMNLPFYLIILRTNFSFRAERWEKVSSWYVRKSYLLSNIWQQWLSPRISCCFNRAC